MPFTSLNLHFPTIAGFAQWLATCPRPEWSPDGIRYHNTYRPNEAQWRGHASMESMAAGYSNKGWSTGPHIFLATGTAFDGIWVMCPPWQPAIHAGACNSHAFGIENVGDWDKFHPTEVAKALLVAVCAALTAYAGRSLDLAAHRDCMPGRTCPGRYGYAIKAELQQRLANTLHTTQIAPAYTEHSPLLAPVSGDSDTYAAAWLRCASRKHYVEFDIRVIASAYWTECARLGLDAWLVAAQVMHETGNLSSWWCARPRRNPAGIGVDGSSTAYEGDGKPGAFNTDRARWEHGLSFADWLSDSIPAHLGRLLAYATTQHNRSPEQGQAVVKALAYRSLPATMFGSAQTIRQLGRVHNPSGQGWASPGEWYGAKLAEIANVLRGLS